MTKEELYNKLLCKLPLSRDENQYFPEYIKEIIGEYHKLVKSVYETDERYQQVIHFTEKILKSIKAYFDGDIFSSYKEFAAGLSQLLEKTELNQGRLLPIYNCNYDDMYFFEKGSVETLYRVTEYENSIWHIPFQKRHFSSTGRFSLPGIPCLYLSDSISTCLKELNDLELKREYYVSSFEFDYSKVKILDLTLPKIIVRENVEEYFDGAILSWPLVAICMIKKPDGTTYQNAKFVCEYLFPQFVLNFFCFEHGIQAVKYFSTKNEEVGSYNVAIPIRESQIEGHCSEVKNVFIEDDKEHQKYYRYKVSKPQKIYRDNSLYISKVQAEISNADFNKIE